MTVFAKIVDGHDFTMFILRLIHFLSAFFYNAYMTEIDSRNKSSRSSSVSKST